MVVSSAQVRMRGGLALATHAVAVVRDQVDGSSLLDFLSGSQTEWDIGASIKHSLDTFKSCSSAHFRRRKVLQLFTKSTA